MTGREREKHVCTSGHSEAVCRRTQGQEKAQHAFCAIPAKDTKPESNQKKTDKPTLRDTVQNNCYDHYMSRSGKPRQDGADVNRSEGR